MDLLQRAIGLFVLSPPGVLMFFVLLVATTAHYVFMRILDDPGFKAIPVHWANVLTHAPGFHALVQLHLSSAATSSYLSRGLLLCSLCASCLMHLSETKHLLPGLFGLGRYSDYCLNLDRAAAVILALYVGAHAMVWQDVTVLGAFIILGVITTAGELTQHWGWYVTLHSIWHVGVFRLAGHVLILAESAPASERWVWQQGPAIGPTILLATVLTISLVLVVAVVFHPPWLTPVLERVLPPMVMRIPPQPADNGQEKVLYLTFDDGPTDWMDRIIDTIKHSPYGNDAGATFFVVGENIQSFLKAREYTRGNAVMMNAYNDRLRTIDRNVSHVNPINLDERKSNYSLANHMMLQERAALKLSTNAFLNSLTQTDRLIQYHPSDEKTRRWVRPASGLATREQIQVANTAGYCVVLGSVHPFEAKPAWFWRWAWRLAVWHLKLWFTQIDHATYGRPIVILHEREWTPDVLAEILPWWHARGWQIHALPLAATVN